MRKKTTSTHHNRPKGVNKRTFERVYWPYLPLIVVVSLVLTFSSLGVRAMTDIRGGVLAYATSMSSSGLLSNTNQKRSANGASNLSINSQLSAAAQAKANDMASRNYWSHNTPEGNPPWIFVDNQGYDYQKIGENLAAGFTSESAVVTGWMNSAAHRANMLDTAFAEVGFGWANNADYTSAGGGPMTVVVAFYGASKTVVIPTPCPDGQIGTPPNCAIPPTQVTTKPKTSSPTPASVPTPVDQQKPTLIPDKPKTEIPVTAKEQPINSDKPVPATSPTERTSQLQLVLGSSATKVATSLAFSIMIITGGLWIMRHVLIARRAVNAGENFVIHHPIIDVTLMAIMAIAYLMTRTTGLIQ